MRFPSNLDIKKMSVFFPKLAPGHGSTHGYCNHPRCELDWGPVGEPHFQEPAEVAEKFLISRELGR